MIECITMYKWLIFLVGIGVGIGLSAIFVLWRLAINWH